MGHPYRKQLQQYVQNILITKFRKVNVRNYFDIPTSVKEDGLKSVADGFIMTRTVSNADLQKTIQDKISREYGSRSLEVEHWSYEPRVEEEEEEEEKKIHYNTDTSQLEFQDMINLNPRKIDNKVSLYLNYLKNKTTIRNELKSFVKHNFDQKDCKLDAKINYINGSKISQTCTLTTNESDDYRLTIIRVETDENNEKGIVKVNAECAGNEDKKTFRWNTSIEKIEIEMMALFLNENPISRRDISNESVLWRRDE